MRVAAPVLAIVTILCASSCALVGRPTAPPTAAPTTPSMTPATPRPTPIDDEVTRLIAGVAGGASPEGSELDVVWRSIISEIELAGAGEYVAPSRLVPYHSGELPDSECSSGTAPRFWKLNAFYCRAERSILYDETWLRDFAGRAGRYAPAAIIAHEWGHHVQAVLGISGYSIQIELQADCLAGLFLANTEEVLPGVAGPEDDLEATLKTFFEIGNSDYEASAWFQAGEHGSSQQRIRAFGTGYTSSFKTPDYPPPVGRGLAVCYGYRDFKTPDFGDFPPYRLLNLPGRTENAVDGAYVIQPEERLGFPTSAVLLAWLPGSTAEEIVAGFGERFPGVATFPLSIDLAEQVRPGSGLAHLFEQRSPDLPGGVRSGMLGLVQPKVGAGGLAILVYRDAPMISEPLDDAENRQLMEQMSMLYEILARLCGPDDSGFIGEPNLKLSCLDDQ